MNEPNREIFERNLQLLIGRCYKSVLPEASFREGLREQFIAEVKSQANGFEDIQPASTLRELPRILLPLAAAVLLFAYLQTRTSETENTPLASLSEILKEQAVALRSSPRDSWRKWEAGSVTDTPFELVTPLGSRASVALATTPGRIDLSEATHVRASTNVSDELSIVLQSGEFTLERPEPSKLDQQAKYWILGSPVSSVRLAHGELLARRITETDDLLVTVLNGAAEAFDGRDWISLRAGMESRLSDGVLQSSDESLNSPTTEPNRSAVAVIDSTPTDQEEATKPDSQSSLSIVVTFEKDSLPLPAFKISVLKRGSSTEIYSPKVFNITDASDGRVNLNIKKPGSYCVDVVANGFAPTRVDSVMVDNLETVHIDVQLNLGRGMKGIVLDPDGVPVRGATVLSETEAFPQPLAMDASQLAQLPTQTALTDEAGRFELQNLAFETHVLRASHPEFATGWSIPVTPIPDEESREVRIQLTNGGSIRGRVESVPGVPVSGIEVLASLSDTGGPQTLMAYRIETTDQFGKFEINRLPAGYYALVKLGSDENRADQMQPEFHLIEVLDGEVSEFDFIPDRTGVRFSGRLFTDSGSPVPNMGLSLLAENDGGWEDADQLFAQTNPDGLFVFPETLPNRYQMFLTPDRGMTVVFVGQFEVEDTSEFQRDFTVSSQGFGGIVRDKLTGQPLGNCFVNLLKIESAFDPGTFAGRQITRSDGRFFFPHVHEYYYRLTAQSTVTDYGHEVLEAVLPMADAAPVVLELEAGGTLSIHVVNQDGVHLKGVELKFLDHNGLSIGFSANDKTDAVGEFKTKGLRPGTWTITASAPDVASVTRVCQVVANLTENLVFVIEQKKD